ncbi:tyrosine-type recombinase/integrase [Isoptericola rhizosphaerae]|uniref:tyrosine-type recombinase/integrase n=1 Tax=Isoptericola rhizosphaerae TaxID=3377837 RepID=UPI00383A8E03
MAETTAATDRWMMRHVPDAVRKKQVGQLTGSDVSSMYASLMQDGMSRATCRRMRQSFNSALSWAERQGYVRASPARGVTEPRGTGADDRREIRPVREDDLRQMEARQRSIAGQYADLTIFAWETGLRSGEVRALRVRDVLDVPIPALWVTRSAPDGASEIRTTTKGGRGRRVPLTPRAEQIVKRWAEGKSGDALLFPNAAGDLLTHRGMLRRLRWHSVGERAGTGLGFRWHDLRHGAAVRWLVSGMDPKTVQAWLGHASATVTLDRYAHYVGVDADRAALKRLAALELRGHDGGTEPTGAIQN